ncbi:hypothetical protein AURDEDRAFT_160239 [Auricularia subglabra TFB-10046 SS5]|nr:hypothetical protein AURDEDRAFT_160239 [Auricularia subglabra TFB-10046 SS5]
MQPQTWEPLDPYWNDVRTAYAVAGGLLWPQDPSAQGLLAGRATIASAAAADVLSAGQVRARRLASEGGATGGPFAFGQDNQGASFDFTVPPGSAVAAALAPSAVQQTAAAADDDDRGSSGHAAGSSQDASDEIACDFTSLVAWWYFIVDLWEAISTNANSFEEVWCRYLGPATEASSTSALGPRAQENQNNIQRHMPTPDEAQTARDILFIASFRPHLNVPAPPKSPRRQALSLNNGRMTRERTETHTEECDICRKDGKTSWHKPEQIKDHKLQHEAPLQACILCGKPIRTRGDAPTTHRRDGFCGVYKQLKAGGNHFVRAWATYWGLMEHKQWGAGAHIKTR